MADLDLQHLVKVYDGGVCAVDDFNLKINDGEFVVLVGPSGCGKSTTLRMIAGLEGITKGKLLIDDKDVTDKPSKDRDIAMVFQNYALYGNMTVYQNMGFSLMLNKVNPQIIHKKIMAAAKMLDLLPQLNKKPRELSGGQRQRVAMGRAIVRNPKVFLFDEPLSNLDAKLRAAMRREIKLLHHRLGTTMIYVTHDQVEALTLADRIVVMSMGEVQQIGTPYEIYNDPNNIFVGAFIGNPPMNFFSGIVKKDKFVGKCCQFALNEESLNLVRKYDGKEIVMGIRPESFILGTTIDFEVELVEPLGRASLVHGKIGEYQCVIKLNGWQDFKEGEKIKLDFAANKLCFFDKETSKRIRNDKNEEQA
ncbi:MAG: sn-glycerol-3-phosphate ABC transporter ATP-binding protein UgpC [Bacteroidaceae bacterium]